MMALQPGRPVRRTIVQPLTPDGSPVVLYERWSSTLAWRILRRFADDASAVAERVAGNAREARLVHRELRAFVHQAERYYEVGERTGGAPSALPFYYAILNLAKAELLIAHGQALLERRLHHGLSVPSPKGLRTDRLGLRDGVFRLLYTKRIGRDLQQRNVPVGRVIGNVPSIRNEVSSTSFVKANAHGGWNCVARNDRRLWSLLAFESDEWLAGRTPTSRLFFRHFRRIETPREWRRVFGISTRFSTPSLHVFESKTEQELPEQATLRPFMDQMAAPWTMLHPTVGFSNNPGYDLFIYPHLYRSKPFPMTGSLAAYAALFYVSSLVRYAPSMVDARSHPEQAWLLGSIPTEVAPLLLHAAINEMLGTYFFFGSPESMRA